MAFFIETPTWVDNIYLLHINDTVTGGTTGDCNKPYQDLANRTNYLNVHILAHLHDQRYHTKAEVLDILAQSCLVAGEPFYVAPSSETTHIDVLNLSTVTQYLLNSGAAYLKLPTD